MNHKILRPFLLGCEIVITNKVCLIYLTCVSLYLYFSGMCVLGRSSVQALCTVDAMRHQRGGAESELIERVVETEVVETEVVGVVVYKGGYWMDGRGEWSVVA